MEQHRRDFLKLATSLSAGIVLTGIANKLGGCNTVSKVRGSNDVFGLQLYTLRNEMPKDPKGVLKQVASFGYKQIESYEHDKLGIFWGMSNTEFKKYMDELGMKIVSSHCDIDKNFQQKADQASAIGMKYLICPYIGRQKSLDDYKRFADKFNDRGEICKKAGIRFAYHNHEYTFQKQEDQYPHDILMQNTDKNLVDYEMDIYWVVTAGEDPVNWLNKYPGRFTLSHVKNRKKGARKSERDATTTIEGGQIDFPAILTAAKRHGMKYFIVEQEHYEGTTPLKAVKQNADYLKKLKI
jgi:sugar phosphate isomerase/epimerase